MANLTSNDMIRSQNYCVNLLNTLYVFPLVVQGFTDSFERAETNCFGLSSFEDKLGCSNTSWF
jgi:hypothetical protein